MRRYRKEIVVPPLPETVRRVWQLAGILGFVLVVILYKIWSLQVLENQDYLRQSKENYERRQYIPSQRGTVYDRKGRVLAEDVESFDVYLDGTKLTKAQRQEAATRLRPIISIRKGALREADAHGRYLLAKQISFEQMVMLRERELEFPWVEVESIPGRRYPYGDLAAHVLGFVGPISDTELQAHTEGSYKKNDRIGKDGIEKQFENILRGRDGEQIVQHDAFGRFQQVLREVSPVQRGKDLVLSIDVDMQRVCEEVLGASRGAIVVSDPRDGSLLALASYPRYDPNHFYADYRKNLFDESQPLYHRAVQGLYPPGSTFKLFEAVAVLELGIDEHQTVGCTGLFRLPTRTKPWQCHIWGSHHRGHGSVDLYTAIQKSCNTYFYNRSLKTGPNLLADWAEQFGLGVPTQIDLPTEKTVPFPCPANGFQWYTADTLNIAIGQGKLSVTPMQMNVASSVIANATEGMGTVYQPRVALGELDHFENGIPIAKDAKPIILRTVKANLHTWKVLKEAAWLVCNTQGGTGRRAQVDTFAISGKTGSSQHGINKPTHAWFTCWGPTTEDDSSIPSLVITILAEHAGHGGEAASILVPKIIEVYLHGEGQEVV